MTPVKQHGGAREGSGKPVLHPEGRTISFGVTMPAELAAAVSEKATEWGCSRSAALCRIIREHPIMCSR